MCRAEESVIQLQSAYFTSESYTGYISENVAAPSALPPDNQMRRLRSSINQTTSSNSLIYIRFVDYLKPTLVLELWKGKCEQLRPEDVPLITLKHNDLFLTEMGACDPLGNSIRTCECPIYIRLLNDSVRERLNREAKEFYSVHLKFFSNQTNIQIQLLDDNDLDPMFEYADYLFELNEDSNLPAFAKIGKVTALDPDLSRNAIINYYMAKNDHNFGVDFNTGWVFLKRPLSYLCENEERDEFELEIQAIDAGSNPNSVNNIFLTKNQPAIFDRSDFEQFLVKSIVRTNQNLFQNQNNLEWTIVKVKLNRSNLTAMTFTCFTDIDKTHSFNEQLKYVEN